MIVFDYFKGDDQISDIKEMQYQMYAYSISTMFHEVKSLILERHYAALYLERGDIETLKNTPSYDHRLMQFPHDCLAAVFRYKMLKNEFPRELFEPGNEDIISYFKSEYIDSDFLHKIDQNYWYLTLKWHRFIKDSLNHHFDLTREISKAVLFYNQNNNETKQAWAASHKCVDIIKELNPEVPWLSRH